MSHAGEGVNRRVLLIDDNEAIHSDFRKILTPPKRVDDDLLAAEAALFGDAVAESENEPGFELTSALQGREGFELAVQARAAGRPFALAFVDMRMPPGWDGIETIENLWRECPNLQVVICTAFSDYSWQETADRLGATDRLLIVKKPFDQAEVLQAAHAMTRKWSLHEQQGHHMDQLSEMVAERTKELEGARDELVAANQELVQARDAAEEASRTKTRILANTSHELRTPMTAILGYSEELQQHYDESTDTADFLLEAVSAIHRNARHLTRLIGDLLDVSRLDADKLALSRDSCPVNSILNDLQSMFGARAGSKGLRFEVSAAPDVPDRITTDAVRLRQILVNLVGNAVKFTERGAVTVEVDCCAAPDRALRVAVTDTGIGMREDVLAKVFQRFEQGDASTTRRFGGTGLGLAISRELAQRLGGDIAATSSVGAGSQFVLTIPIGAGGGAQPESEAAGSDAALVTDLAVRVLLVEDGRDNRRLIVRILERAGCTVEFVENGAECLDRFAEGPAFDAVLMDMQMPVMGGIEATRRLRELGHTLPIIALTANASREDERECIAAGCDAFLTKPIRRPVLLATIREQHEQRRTPAGS